MPNQFHSFWTDDLVQSLTQLWAEGHSATRIAARLNCSRNAVIGKVTRLGLPEPGSKLPVVRDMSYIRQIPEVKAAKRRERERIYAKVRREKQKHDIKTKREIRQRFLERGASPYSAAYRKHLPPMPEMSKSQMRAMLAQALENTAAL